MSAGHRYLTFLLMVFKEAPVEIIRGINTLTDQHQGHEQWKQNNPQYELIQLKYWMLISYDN